jgi:hypothetical protein
VSYSDEAINSVTAIFQKDTPAEKIINLVRNDGNRKVFTFPNDQDVPLYLRSVSVAVQISQNNFGAFVDTFKCQRFDGLETRIGSTY